MKKILYMVCFLLTLASCSEKDDWNTPSSLINKSASQTLWQNMEEQGNLSQFMELAKRVGYDKELQNSRYLTVWAPSDGSFNFDSLNHVSDELLLQRFVKNHIANYDYRATSGMRQRVRTLNEKSYWMEADEQGQPVFDGIPVSLSNVAASNGRLHVLAGQAPYYNLAYHQIFDWVDEAPMFAQYVRKFEHRKLDVSKSIEGPVDENGNQTYIDSVMFVTNDLAYKMDRVDGKARTNLLRAAIADEDSSYTMLVPTDAAYQKYLERIAPYFHYADATQYYEIPASGDLADTVKVCRKQVVYSKGDLLSDSVSRLNVVSDLFFSNTDSYNSSLANDTLRSTYGRKLPSAGLLSAVVKQQQLSNGKAYLISEIPYQPGNSVCPDIHVPITSEVFRPRVNNVNQISVVKVGDGEQNLDKGDRIQNYLSLSVSKVAKPEVFFYVPHVMSATYDVYIVLVPSDVLNENKDVKSLPQQVRLFATYADASGSVGKATCSTASPTEIIGTVTSNPARIDTLKVGQITFPVAYEGLGCYPVISVKSMQHNASGKYDNNLRIANIILKQVE